MEILIPIESAGAGVDCIQAGDLISYHPDGHPWTERERTHPKWRIVRVNVLQSTLDAMASQTESIRGQKQRFRDYAVDLSLLPNPSLFTGARTQEIISLTRKQCTDAIVKKV